MQENRSLIDTISSVFVPVHKDGYKFVIAFAVITLVLISVSELLGWLGTDRLVGNFLVGWDVVRRVHGG